MSREFANGPRDRCSIPGRVIPKTRKIELYAALLNTHHYKVSGGARGVVVIVVGNGHDDASSNRERD